jgi:hypothetical protein
MKLHGLAVAGRSTRAAPASRVTAESISSHVRLHLPFPSPEGEGLCPRNATISKLGALPQAARIGMVEWTGGPSDLGHLAREREPLIITPRALSSHRISGRVKYYRFVSLRLHRDEIATHDVNAGEGKKAPHPNCVGPGRQS